MRARQISNRAGRDMAFPAENAEQIKQHYPTTQPLSLHLSPQQAYERALAVGTNVQELVSAQHRDRLTGVPLHKYIPAKVRKVRG